MARHTTPKPRKNTTLPPGPPDGADYDSTTPLPEVADAPLPDGVIKREHWGNLPAHPPRRHKVDLLGPEDEVLIGG